MDNIKRLFDNKKICVNIASAIVLLAVILFVSYPAAADVVYAGHDLLGLSGRIEGIRDAWECGQIFPVVMPYANNGYGYLEFMYPELFLLIPAFLLRQGRSMAFAIHAYIFLINILTGLAGFAGVKSVLESFENKKNSSLPDNKNSESILITIISTLASCFYLMGMYRLADVYIRAAIGEAVSMAFLPLALAGIYHLLDGNRKKWWMAVVGMSGILNSHILSSMLIIPVIIIFGLFYIRNIINEKRWKEILMSLGAFFVLNAWFIIPFVRFYLFGLNTEALIFTDIENHTTLLMHVFATSSGEAGQGYFLISLGIGSLIVLIMTIVCGVYNVDFDNKRSDGELKLLGVISLVFGIYLVLSLDIMPLVWVKIMMPALMKILNMLQFPFRLLTICSVCLMYMLAVAIYKTEVFRKNVISFAVMLLLLSVWSSGTLMSEYTGYTVGMTQDDSDFTGDVPDDYLPKGIDKSIFDDTTTYIGCDGASIECVKKGTDITVIYNSPEDTVCSVPLLYYPCYRAVDENGNNIEVFQQENKRLGMILPAGNHTVKLLIKLY